MKRDDELMFYTECWRELRSFLSEVVRDNTGEYPFAQDVLNLRGADMSKSWTPEELAAASAAMKAEGHMSYEEFCAAPVLRLEHRGRDSWDRPVYECDGRLYVDVDPRRSRPADICTKQGNAFDGEPCDPVPEGTIIEFVPDRDTRDF